MGLAAQAPEGNIMAVKTKSKAKAPTNPRAPRGRSAADVKLQATVVKRLKAGDKLSEIADSLGITSGKAAWLNILHRVDSGDVPAIEAKTEAKLLTVIKAERAKAYEFSAWHWIAARTGYSESKVKAVAEAGGVTVSGSNIAAERAAKNPKPKATKTAKTPAAKKAAAKAGRAAVTTRRKRRAARPS
jgi:hypothetical protein